jgi:hypothetical protein
MHGLTRSTILSLLLASLALSVQAAEPLYIAPKLSVAKEADISPKLLAECPLQEDFSKMLLRALDSEGGTFSTGSLPRPKGRSLKVELADLSISGNGFIGHQQYMHLRGALYQDGRKVAAFTDRAQFQDQGFTTACYEIRMALRAETYYIGRWVRNPVDGQELKHFGE